MSMLMVMIPVVGTTNLNQSGAGVVDVVLNGKMESPSTSVSTGFRMSGAAVLDVGCDDVVAALLALRDQRHATVIIRDAGRKRTALELLRACALARLVLDDVPHIAVSAVELGPALTAIALDYGVDEIVECLAQEAAA